MKPYIILFLGVIAFWFTLKAYHEAPQPVKTCSLTSQLTELQWVTTEWEIPFSEDCNLRSTQ